MTFNDPKVYIEHILENLRDIDEFSKNLNKTEFLGNKLKQNAIVRSIEIIGEAVKNLPESFKKNYPQVPWKKIAGTRDRIIHHYFGIDLDIIWDIIKKDNLKLKKQIQEIKRVP